MTNGGWGGITKIIQGMIFVLALRRSDRSLLSRPERPGGRSVEPGFVHRSAIRQQKSP